MSTEPLQGGGGGTTTTEEEPVEEEEQTIPEDAITDDPDSTTDTQPGPEPEPDEPRSSFEEASEGRDPPPEPDEPTQDTTRDEPASSYEEASRGRDAPDADLPDTAPAPPRPQDTPFGWGTIVERWDELNPSTRREIVEWAEREPDTVQLPEGVFGPHEDPARAELTTIRRDVFGPHDDPARADTIPGNWFGEHRDPARQEFATEREREIGVVLATMGDPRPAISQIRGTSPRFGDPGHIEERVGTHLFPDVQERLGELAHGWQQFFAEGEGEGQLEELGIRGEDLVSAASVTLDPTRFVLPGDDTSVSERVIRGSTMSVNAPGIGLSGLRVADAGVEIARDPRAGTQAAAGSASAAAREFGAFARESPLETAGALGGAILTGRVISPIRVSRARIQTGEAGTTAVSGVRLQTPLAAEMVGVTPRTTRTIVGARGFRPTAGAPRVRLEDVAFRRSPERTRAFEPGSQLETEVFGRSVRRDLPAEQAERFTAAWQAADIGESTPGRLRLRRTEDIIREARSVPAGAEADLARVLREQGATIKGSAAARAQLPEGVARRPRDVDVVVDDPQAFRRAAAEALEGYDASVSDVFDIAPRSEFPAAGGVVKFGQRAPRRLRTEEGVEVTSLGEEMLRKAGASAFVRGPRPGSPGIDVGPEFTSLAPNAVIRAKDPADALRIGREVTAPGTRQRARVERFGQLFEEEISSPHVSNPPAVLDPATAPGRQSFIARFLGSTRAQAELPFARSQSPGPVAPSPGTTIPLVPTRGVETELGFEVDDVSPSPRTPSPGSPAPSPTIVPPSPAASPPSDIPELASPAPSPAPTPQRSPRVTSPAPSVEPAPSPAPSPGEQASPVESPVPETPAPSPPVESPPSISGGPSPGPGSPGGFTQAGIGELTLTHMAPPTPTTSILPPPGEQGPTPDPGQPTRPQPTIGGDPWLVPGWVAETVTDIGTRGMASGRAPTQATLFEQPLSDMLTGELRTFEQLEGDVETRRRITEAETLLGVHDQPGEEFENPLAVDFDTKDDGEGIPLL